MKFAGKLTRTILLGWLLSSGTFAYAQGDGIFAEFNTSLGSYTCRVDYAKAPKASASFIGLATGERAWLDLTSGLVRNDPYYDGQIFHRVIAGFMNQGGSPNGQGTDGPGYSFVDEFDSSLRHDGFGVLSSANSGPDSNGSQFFVTVAPATHLDDKHTVFGRLVGGSNVVYEINTVATTNARPFTNVVLQSVEIRRVGAAAQAFDIRAQGLPEVTGLDTGIARVGSNVSLSFTNQLNADNRLYSTTNLASWSEAKLGIETIAPVASSLELSATASHEFFRMAQVRYASSTLAPKNVFDGALTLRFNGGYGTNIITFNSSGGGGYDWTIGYSGAVTSYTWIQEPYNGKLWPIYMEGLYATTLELNFTNDSSGSFSGTYYQPAPLSLSGGFTLVQ